MARTNFEATIIERLFEEIRVGVYAEIKPRMLEAMETAFDEAWSAAMRRLAGSPAIDTEAAGTGPVVMTVTPKLRSRGVSNVPTRAPWGTTNTLIQKAFEAHPIGGMTPKQIADWGSTIGVHVAASSVRSTLQRMQHDGEARRRKTKYYPAKASKEPERATNVETLVPHAPHAVKETAA
jgi:hypothetical protein